MCCSGCIIGRMFMEEECLVYRQMTETKRICSLRLLLLLTPYLITAFTSNGRHSMYLTPLTRRRGEGWYIE